MKKNTELLIDGENMSYRNADTIMDVVASQGILFEAKVYGRQKDIRTRRWSEEARKHGLKDIRLYGCPQKNKVDDKIIHDAKRILNHDKNIDIFVIATSDSDYVDIIKELRTSGKRVVVVGDRNAPDSLRSSCNKFIEI